MCLEKGKGTDNVQMPGLCPGGMLKVGIILIGALT